MESVIFVCRMNSCRSQIAEGYAHLLGSQIFSCIKSAGLVGKSFVNQNAIEIMSDVYDISNQSSNPITDYSPKDFSIVVSLCGCSASLNEEWPKCKRVEDWNVEDPDGGSREKFLEVRDEIEKRVLELVASIKEKRDPNYSITGACEWKRKP